MANREMPDSVAEILIPFFKALRKMNVEYCVLHSYDTLPETVASDLDIAIHNDTISNFEALLTNVARENNWEIIQRLWYDIPKCFYYVLRSSTFPFRWVAVDILIDSSGIGRYGFSTKTLVCNRIDNGLFFHSEPSVEFCYKLIKRVRKGAFKHEDNEILTGLFIRGNQMIIKNILAEHFGKKNASRVIAMFSSARGFTGHLQNISSLSGIQLLRKRYCSPAIIVRRSFWQIKRIIHRVANPSGLAVQLHSQSYPNSSREREMIIAEIGPAFRHVYFREKFSYRDMLLSLSTSTLLIVPGAIREKHACLMRDYLDSSEIVLSAENSVSAVDSQGTLPVLVREVVGIMKLRMNDRLNPTQ